jgi:hypothetical protein
MEPVVRTLLLSLALSLSCAAAPAAPSAPHPYPAKASLRAFDNEAEFQALLERWRDAARQRQQEGRRRSEFDGGLAMQAAPSAAPMAKSAAKASADSAAALGANESITNVQTAGVDEGGIVKRAGDHLVILRRGRLFTVRVGGDDLRPVAAVDAYAPGSNPQGAWYDELLIHGRTIVVVGFSYARGGTEIGLFELGDDGSIAYRATHHLKSHDYYSSRNYASRLVGNRLVFYAPMRINPWQLDGEHFMPQWRRWHPAYGHQPSPQDWTRILPATRIFRTDDDLDPFSGATLHTVTACELRDRSDMQCQAQAVLAAPGRVFYVSADNVFVWTTASARREPWGRGDDGAMPRSSVVRMPLDGTAPSALKTTGAPIDQLSFLQDSDGHLNVLLRSHARGEGMWQAEGSQGDFGSGRDIAPRSAYRPLAGVPGHMVHNRYVGDWLLFGAVGHTRLQALRYADAWRDASNEASQPAAATIELKHGVERIEALGDHALVVGNAGRDLHATTLRLDRGASIAGSLVQVDAAQGEMRSHGFFYRATSREEGLLGLPVVAAGSRGRHGMPIVGPQGASASVAFIRNRALELEPIGKLDARATSADDGCKASCVDWYGNARPIFLGDRVFALMGYELVEGRLDGSVFRAAERINERRRIDFAPRAASRWGREE